MKFELTAASEILAALHASISRFFRRGDDDRVDATGGSKMIYRYFDEELDIGHGFFGGHLRRRISLLPRR